LQEQKYRVTKRAACAALAFSITLPELYLIIRLRNQNAAESVAKFLLEMLVLFDRNLTVRGDNGAWF